MREPAVLDYFLRLVQRTSPKSHAQAKGEVVVTQRVSAGAQGAPRGGGKSPLRPSCQPRNTISPSLPPHPPRRASQFLENFNGDNVRFLARSFGVPGNHEGQQSNGYRFPFGAVALITPFNFPIEIPA